MSEVPFGHIAVSLLVADQREYDGASDDVPRQCRKGKGVEKICKGSLPVEYQTWRSDDTLVKRAADGNRLFLQSYYKTSGSSAERVIRRYLQEQDEQDD